MAIAAVIPARLRSTRLPNKPLADIAGKPMIVRVAERVSEARLDEVFVAVDDQRVFDVVAEAGFRAVMTDVDHRSGSDRVMQVAREVGLADTDVVINVQGDEPLMPPAVVEQLATALQDDPQLGMATLAEPIVSNGDLEDPNIVKVVCDLESRALYFSRAPIPYFRDRKAPVLSEQEIRELAPRRHIGIYGFRVAALARFVTLTDSRLERLEMLEQLRWLEAGEDLLVLDSCDAVPGGVDTPADLERVIQRFAAG